MPLAPWLLLAAGLLPGDAETDRLVRQLGSPAFAEREAASKQLGEHGEAAREALEKATANEDAEIRRRARRLLDALDHRSVQGTWDCVDKDGPRLIVRDNQMTFRRHADTVMTFTLAPGETPRAIDFTLRSQVVIRGIYSVRAGEFRLGLPLGDDLKRPAAFANDARSVTLTFRRPKPPDE